MSLIQNTMSHVVHQRTSDGTIYGDVGTDRLNKITASLGFGDIIQCPTAINDNYNLRRDLGERGASIFRFESIITFKLTLYVRL